MPNQSGRLVDPMSLGHLSTTQFMKRKRLLMLGFSALLVFVACRRAPSDMPSDGFRLTVQDILTDPDLRVAQLVMVSSSAGTSTTDADLSHQSVVLPDAASGRGRVSLIAIRVAPSGQPWAYFQTLIRIQTAKGGLGGGPAFEALPIATELSSFFTITAKSGDYSFDTPFEIATLRGKPVTLTLKKGAK